MDKAASQIEVKNNEAAQRFEVVLDGQVAFAQYQLDGSTIIFTHTEVPEAFEGKGVASTLVRTALETARNQKLAVIPLCPFVASYIRRHQAEYLDLVPTQYQPRLLNHKEA